VHRLGAAIGVAALALASGVNAAPPLPPKVTHGGGVASKPTVPVAVGAGCANAGANPAPDTLGAMPAAVLCLLNGERAGHGLPPLRSNRPLRTAATSMATQMVKQQFFGHVTPSGADLLDRIRRTGYVHGNWVLGENLAWGNGPLATPQAIVNGWMNSPDHRANILYGRFKDIGIGVQLGAPRSDLSGGATYVTDFGRHT
jgi:uncharacterized protein YkwD